MTDTAIPDVAIQLAAAFIAFTTIGAALITQLVKPKPTLTLEWLLDSGMLVVSIFFSLASVFALVGMIFRYIPYIQEEAYKFAYNAILILIGLTAFELLAIYIGPLLGHVGVQMLIYIRAWRRPKKPRAKKS